MLPRACGGLARMRRAVGGTRVGACLGTGAITCGLLGRERLWDEMRRLGGVVSDCGQAVVLDSEFWPGWWVLLRAPR